MIKILKTIKWWICNNVNKINSNVKEDVKVRDHCHYHWKI